MTDDQIAHVSPEQARAFRSFVMGYGGCVPVAQLASGETTP